MRFKGVSIGLLLVPVAAFASGQVGPWNDTAPSKPRPWNVCHVVEQGGSCQGENSPAAMYTLTGAQEQIERGCRDTGAAYEGGDYMIKLTNKNTGQVREYLCSNVRQQMHG